MAVVMIAGSAAADGNDVPLLSSRSEPTEITVSQPKFRALTLGTYKLVFEKTLLRDLRAEAKTGKIIESGDAGEYDARLCYRFRDHGRPASVCFSVGEIDGGAISQVVVSSKVKQDYAELPARLQPVASDTGLGLNALRADFTKRLGPTIMQTGTRAIWSFRTKVVVDGEYWWCHQSIDVEFTDGKATSITFYRTTQDA